MREFKINDAYYIAGRGTIADVSIDPEEPLPKTGRIELVSHNGDVKKVTLTGFEYSTTLMHPPRRHHRVGLVLRGITKEDVEAAQLVRAT